MNILPECCVHIVWAYCILFCFSVPSKGPNITTISVVNSTALKVTWAKLSSDYSNGNITKYAVCYNDKTSSSTCLSNKTIEGADKTMIVLIGLNEATTYYIGIWAATKIGFGKLGDVKSNRTFEDSKWFSLHLRNSKCFPASMNL